MTTGPENERTAPPATAPPATAPPATPAVIGPIEPWGVARAAALGLDEPVRSWTPLGTVDAAAVADVDPSGLVQLRGATWSLDWWVGAEDRWHHPARDATVRQRSIEATPVVETAMRVPGGDVVHRCYGARATASDAQGDEQAWDDSAVVVEIENLTSVPVALALAFRPVTLDGVGAVRTASVDGPVITIDDRVAAVLSKQPLRQVIGPIGAPAQRLADDDDEPAGGACADGAGRLEAVYVVPLPHSSVMRVLLPRVAEPAGRRARDREAEPGSSWSAPGSDAIVSGWQAHTRAAAGVELPDPALVEVCEASVRTLMLASGDDFFDGDGERTAAERAAELCDVLVRAGLEEPLGPIARALVGSIRLGGSVRMQDRSDASVALVHAATPLLVGRNAGEWIEELLEPVAAAVHRLGKGKGLGAADGWLTRSAAVALGRLGPSVRTIGQPDLAVAAEELSASLYLNAPSAPSGTGTTTNALGCRASVRSGSPDAIAGAMALARLGTPAVLGDRYDAEGNGTGRLAIDPAAIATRLGAVLDVLVVEEADGPVIVPAWNEIWFGQPMEAHRIRTRWGLLSFAIRWHGTRPAVLWEIERGPGVELAGDGPLLRASGLDGRWTGQGWTGEALLGEHAPPEAVVSLRSMSTPTAPAPAGDAAEIAEGDSFL